MKEQPAVEIVVAGPHLAGEIAVTTGCWDVLVDGQEECRGILETAAAVGIAAAMFRAAGAV